MLLNKKIYRRMIGIVLLLTALIPYTIVQATDDSDYVWSSITEPVTTEVSTSADNSLNLESGSAVLMEQTTGQVLYEHNPHEQLRPASVTKIMSILLIMEAIDSGRISYSDKVSCSENARSMGGSQIWLNETEQLTVDEMLKAICVVSANDYTVQK